MATIAQFAKARKLGKLTRVLYTPWISETEEGSGKTYELKNIVADTVSIDEADSTINDIACETRDEAILQIATLGKVSIALSSGDIPNELLKDGFGYIIDDDGSAYRPSAYKYIWGKFQFVFDSSDDIIEIPKTLITAKVTGTSFSSNMVTGAMSGTAYSKDYTVMVDSASTTVSSALAFIAGGKTALLA